MPVTAPPKPVLKSATFWTTNGPAGAFVYWALIEGHTEPAAIRVTCLLIAGALFGLHACLRTVGKTVYRVCRVAERHPWLLMSLPAGTLLRRLAGWVPPAPGSTPTPSPSPESRP